jgi:L-fuconolactonase
MRIDAHQHFWQYDPDRHRWINDEMSAIRRDFFPGDLATILKTLQIDGTIAVQADETVVETTFLLDLAAKNDFIKAVVGWTDLHSLELEKTLYNFKGIEKLAGFRCVMQGAPDEKYLRNDLFANNLKKLAEHGYTYDLLVYHNQLPALISMTEKLPDNQLILDHVGKPDIRNNQFQTWKEQIKILAKHPGIYCKLSGMVTEANYSKWTYDDLLPYLETSAEYFGIDRICFGSDWPVCLVAGSYNKVYEVIEKFVHQLSKSDQEKIFGLNTLQFYKIKDGSTTKG